MLTLFFSGSKIAKIAGAAALVVILLLGVAGVFAFIYRRKKKRKIDRKALYNQVVLDEGDEYWTTMEPFPLANEGGHVQEGSGGHSRSSSYPGDALGIYSPTTSRYSYGGGSEPGPGSTDYRYGDLSPGSRQHPDGPFSPTTTGVTLTSPITPGNPTPHSISQSIDSVTSPTGYRQPRREEDAGLLMGDGEDGPSLPPDYQDIPSSGRTRRHEVLSMSSIASDPFAEGSSTSSSGAGSGSGVGVGQIRVSRYGDIIKPPLPPPPS